ncbi:MAG: calcineurin-like phosphoesterase C-terminal domain-containing protein [Alistipes sp.]
MKNATFLLLALLLQNWGYAQPISGRVYWDQNQNGQFDRGEKSLRDVGISNGDTIIWTNRHGQYRFAATGDAPLFVVAPDGYRCSRSTLQNSPERVTHFQTDVLNFALYPVARKSSYRVAVVGDIQVDNEEQLGFAQRSILSELSSRTDLDFLIHMGDLVNDKPELLDRATEAISLLPQPAWCVIGNHDLNMDRRPRSANRFRATVGRDITAFFRANTCFILLNNVENSTDSLSTQQLNFLKQLVAHCPHEMLLVVCQHVPMAEMKNRDAILDLLSPHKTLILSAHAHKVFRQTWRDAVSEVSVGAACGTWWTGERDATGIPFAIQQCGTPRNYFVFDFTDQGYSFRVKGVGLDADQQADVWVKGENSSDAEVDQLRDEPEGRIAVNVYGGGETTRVEYSSDGTSWHPLDQTKMIAPTVARTIYMNREGGYPTKFSRRQPLRKSASPHIWATTLPDTLLRHAVKLHFRIRDSHGLYPSNFERIVGTTAPPQATNIAE